MNPRLRVLGLPSMGGLLLIGTGCQHGSGMGAGRLNLPPLPIPPPAALEVHLPTPNRSVDVLRLDRPDFIPPGAKRVGPTNPMPSPLAPENRTKFPSTELAYAPDRSSVLFHDGSQRSWLIIHWLMLLKKNAPAPYGVFSTTTAFETTWSSDSRRFAVTNFSGDNSSEVFVEEVDELRKMPIEVRPLIEEFFPLHVMSAPMFVKAYRWTGDGRLIVRAIGRAKEEPYEEFGCEALVTFTGPAGEIAGGISGRVSVAAVGAVIAGDDSASGWERGAFDGGGEHFRPASFARVAADPGDGAGCDVRATGGIGAV